MSVYDYSSLPNKIAAWYQWHCNTKCTIKEYVLYKMFCVVWNFSFQWVFVVERAWWGYGVKGHSKATDSSVSDGEEQCLQSWSLSNIIMMARQDWVDKTWTRVCIIYNVSIDTFHIDAKHPLNGGKQVLHK